MATSVDMGRGARGGALLAGGAAIATVAAGEWLMAASPGHASLPAIALFAAVAFCLIVALSRLTLPLAIRATLILSLVATSLALAAAGDMFALRGVEGSIDDAVSAERAPGAVDAAPAPPEVAIRPAPGSAVIRIDPVVGATGEGTVDWSIERGAARLRCGRVTLVGDRARALETLRPLMDAALRASAGGTLACG